MKSLETLVLEEITQATTTNKAKLFRQGKEIGGYIAEEMKDGKPTTLLEAQEKPNFCTFIAVAYWDYVNDKIRSAYELRIDATNRKAKGNDFFLDYHFYSCYSISQAEELRKTAHLFAIYHPLKKEMDERAKAISEKIATRRANREAVLNDKRYCYTDKSIKELLANYAFDGWCERLTLWGFSHNSLDKHEHDELTSDHVTFDNEIVHHTAKTRRELFDFIIDKGGMFKLPYLVSLKRRAEHLKAERKAQARANAREEWQKSDKTIEKKIALQMVNGLVRELNAEAENDKPSKDYLTDLSKTLEIASSLLCFEQAENREEWNKKRAVVEDTIKFIHAFRGLRHACKHQYTYNTETNRYEMNEEYKNGFWGENYATTSNEAESI